MYDGYRLDRQGEPIWRDESNGETILEWIQSEAEQIDLLQRVANSANYYEQLCLNPVVESKAKQLSHFSRVYTSMTGHSPVYEMRQVPFRSCSEGLRLACELNHQQLTRLTNFFSTRQFTELDPTVSWAFANDQQHGAVLEILYRNSVKDYGGQPFVVDIEKVTNENTTYRTALWTGDHLQITLMSIDVGDDIGLEVHPTTDQFIRIEEGEGLAQMGDRKNQLDFEQKVTADYTIMVPAGKWHNVTNTGKIPMKLYAIYAPPEHPFGTVHVTKADAMEAEER
ncbi:cupin domain-containing protein [Cytobacillus spongiae]|uniref:cupin domain-containing protein n=1 Tax=Cytobacillus spongiae TaxID=2901381 RepID=UPI001F209017|nr:cupin domain-containing protein [Cytobacillus spongiae]UII57579.1 cupin domain-containing protein [Cytobacillus spongiae]